MALEVQLRHKTIADYFDALRRGGFNRMPVMAELRVTPEHLQIDGSFFAPLLDVPLHMAVSVRR